MNRTFIFLGTAALLGIIALIVGVQTPRDLPQPEPRQPLFKTPPPPPVIPDPPVRPVPQGNGECRGYTWSLKEQRGALVHVGSDVGASNGYRGDTSCDIALPILCVNPQNLSVSEDMQVTQYNGWLGGKVALSEATRGSALTSRAAADALCAAQFGYGWRMGEHHDGQGSVGWGFTGYGTVPAGVRFWVAINDQPANPWNFVSHPVEPTPEHVQYGLNKNCLGYTWSLKEQNGPEVHVGSDANVSNAYRGDTSCEKALPILCVIITNENDPGLIRSNGYNGWLNGKIALTEPISGFRLTSRAVADGLCASQLGIGWRMGEHHDGHGPGWAFNGYGRIPAGIRFWVAINDQPANPWNYLAGQ